MGDDVWLICQVKAGAKKETKEGNERKSCSRVCFSRMAKKAPEPLLYSSELLSNLKDGEGPEPEPDPAQLS